ncbi:MAG TPA: site-specific DNA-methyltransferase, partial [Defluviitoga tunisiensis]|nr:site-specific DNA-methyltransferase [Defluviitoga tunisiensis]
TILPKFKEKVQTIYIDPPYNTGSDEFIYSDKFQQSSWLTMLENRLNLAKEFMKEDGLIFISIGDTIKTNVRIHSKSRLGVLCDEIFKEDNFVATFVRKSGTAPRQDIKHIANAHDYVLCYSKNIDIAKINRKEADISRLKYTDEYIKVRGKFDLNQLDRGSKQYSESLDYPIIIEKGRLITVFDGKSFKKIPAPEKIEIWPGGNPEDKRWIFTWSKEKVEWGIKNDFIVFRKINGKWKVYYKEYELVDNENKPRERTNPYDTLILAYPNELGTSEIENLFGKRLFEYPKPSELIKHLLKIGSEKDSLILDFFAGSGTTAHAVMKLNKEDGGKRIFILIEMADYFYEVIIPRIKKVAYSFNWKDGKPTDADGIGIFVKYYELEQYEDVLRNAKYEHGDLTLQPSPGKDVFNEYIFMRSPKFVETVLKREGNEYKVDLSKIYPEKRIDIAETLSNVLGKKIRKISKESFELEDIGEIRYDSIPVEYIKPLIWW